MFVIRYPKLFIRSKTELARHISHVGFSRQEAQKLINLVIPSHDLMWKDSPSSEPEKGKFVRSAKGTPLGNLLSKINQRILARHDKMLPNFIFGGVNGLSHVDAAIHLLGEKRKRILLKLDIEKFFDQISAERVSYFFQKKCYCRADVAQLLSKLCCVPTGAKGSSSTHRTLGRGFATSSRLAIWCNLGTFIKLERLVQKRLRGKDPRITIYVDDIGIMASRVSEDTMKKLQNEIEALLLSDRHQRLPINHKKTKISSHKEGMEILGIRLERNSISPGIKTEKKINRIKEKIKNGAKKNTAYQHQLKRTYRSLKQYKNYLENARTPFTR